MGLYQPIKGELPYLWLETNYLKVHDGGRRGIIAVRGSRLGF